MAFVYRADRSLDFAKKEQKNLGPGSYIGHGEFRPKHLYTDLRDPYSTDAPFSSKSQRNLHNLPSFAPGICFSHIRRRPRAIRAAWTVRLGRQEG